MQCPGLRSNSTAPHYYCCFAITLSYYFYFEHELTRMSLLTPNFPPPPPPPGIAALAEAIEAGACPRLSRLNLDIIKLLPTDMAAFANCIASGRHVAARAGQ